MSCRWRVNGHQADDVRRTPIVRYFVFLIVLIALDINPFRMGECEKVYQGTAGRCVANTVVTATAMIGYQQLGATTPSDNSPPSQSRGHSTLSKHCINRRIPRKWNPGIEHRYLRIWIVGASATTTTSTVVTTTTELPKLHPPLPPAQHCRSCSVFEGLRSLSAPFLISFWALPHFRHSLTLPLF